MRRNVAKLTRLVRDQGWRWDDVGAAMTRAGISYSTGRAWTPEVLRVKASEARAQNQGASGTQPSNNAQSKGSAAPETAGPGDPASRTKDIPRPFRQNPRVRSSRSLRS